MVSDFIDQHNRYLKLTDAEFAAVKQADRRAVQSARVLLEYGVEHEGYWTSEKFMANVKNAMKIAKFKYPSQLHTVCWVFDQSSCHRAFAEDALNAKHMNVHPGGAQPKMRDTIWAGKLQRMTLADGTPKGMKLVLKERGINSATPKGDDMRTILSFHHDFRNEKTLVEQFILDEGHQVVFLPKFHCELNPIERVWGQAKCHCRQYSNYTLARLRNIIHPALDSVSTDLILKYFRKIGDYEMAYIEGKKAGKEVENAVKVYKSHRRVLIGST